jgi:hypothetical protein
MFSDSCISLGIDSTEFLLVGSHRTTYFCVLSMVFSRQFLLLKILHLLWSVTHKLLKQFLWLLLFFSDNFFKINITLSENDAPVREKMFTVRTFQTLEIF